MDAIQRRDGASGEIVAAIESAREKSQRIAKLLVEARASAAQQKPLTLAKEKAAKRRKLDEGQKKALDWINEHLLDHPDKILAERANLECGGEARSAGRCSAKWKETFEPKKIKVMKQLPKWFLMQASALKKSTWLTLAAG